MILATVVPLGTTAFSSQTLFPFSTGYGRGVFGGNGTRVGLVPKVGAVQTARHDRGHRCHMPGRPRAGLFFVRSPLFMVDCWKTA